MNSFSGNLRNLRRSAGCTQKELADDLNVNFTVVSKWERGVSPS